LYNLHLLKNISLNKCRMFVHLPVNEGFFERKRETQCCFSNNKSNESNESNETNETNEYPNCHVWEFHIIQLMKSKLLENSTN